MSYNNQQETTPAKKHKCQFCAFTSDKPFNVRRHIGRKHPEMNNTNVQSYASPMGIENAGVVYQQNYREVQPPPSYPQHALPGPATVNQVNISPPQQLSHQAGYLGGYDQGGYLSEDKEPDILELLKDTEKIFLETLYIKEEYLFALTKLRRLGDKEIKRFLKRYVRFKVRLMNHYEVIESDESESDESVSPDSDGEGSMDTNDGGDDAEEGEGGVGEVNDGGVGVDEGDESSGSESMDANDGDVDESSESVTDPESLEIEEKDTQEKEGESEKGDEEDLSRDQFFDFIFKVEDYLDEELLGWLKKYEGMAEKEIRMENLNIMSKDSLRDRVNLLNIKHKGKDRLLYMKFCSDDCIHAISECCHNILKNRFKFNNGQKSTVRKKFKPIEADIRRLVKPSTSIKSKRKILQKPQVGNGVLGIIASLVMPALMKLFLK